MGGGTASSSEELDEEIGVCAGGVGRLLELTWQKWKKLFVAIQRKD